MKPRAADRWGEGRVFLLIFALFAAGIVASGILVYRNFERSYRAEVERQLSAIAELKARDLAQWRRGRLGDGRIFFGNDAFAAAVRRHSADPADADARRQLHAWIGGVLQGGHYDRARLLDPRGATLFSIPPGLPPVSGLVSNYVSEVLRSGRVAVQDFYRNDHDGKPYLSLMIPVLDPESGARPLGVLVFRVDPEDHLYPYIRRWPTSSLTAETLLVRREGEETVFLNELRFQTNTAMRLRMPLDRPLLLAAMAALGREGVVDGIDYRGVPVVAAMRSIPDSPWSLVARIDADEIYRPLRERLWIVIAMVALLLFGTGAGIGLAWRQQSTRFYRRQYELSEALRQSARELQEKNVEMERFLYTASHDLKSPVVTIRTFLEYLEQDVAAAKTERIGKDLQFIRAAADKMARLLDELLELSRIGRVVHPPVRVPLRTLAEDALAAAAGGIAARGVRTTVEDRGVTLHGDRLRLAGIWQNLVENAVKFMGDQKAPCIEIGVEAREAETVFFVRDNGIGIDPRFQAKVFGLFEKLDPKAEGTGIGLAIVKRIVELHEGRLWLESEGEGRGACFYFTLPKAIDNPGERERT